MASVTVGVRGGRAQSSAALTASGVTQRDSEQNCCSLVCRVLLALQIELMIAAVMRQRVIWATCSSVPRVGSRRLLHSASASLSKFTCAATPETPFDSTAFRTSLVDSLASLENTKRAVLASTRVALDTEFVRGTNYSPSLELVQLATTDNSIHVVDCRVLEELRRGAVTDLLNAVISKPMILHAADADLQLVYHWTQQLPANGVFDTQVQS